MIRNFKQDPIVDFKGKRTSVNLTNGEPGTLLSAKNLIILNDGMLRRAPGYTQIGTTPIGTGPIKAFHDFQRSVDQKQFIFVQSGSSIYVMNADGTNQQQISSGETGTHQFVQSSFICYSSDGTNAWRYVDDAGTLTKYKWGIAAPATAPSIALGAGTLSLTWGRTYCYCYVSKYTDSLGIQRLSIGPPSHISAATGPVANQVVTLSNIAASVDPQVNFIWIFEVSDSPINTSATYYFAAEIPNGQTSWGDTLPDTSLDQTRLAPFDNNPAPPAPMIDVFQNRMVAVNGALIQLSGYEEITLGIPEEAWPTSLFFDLPSGKRTATCLKTLQQGTQLVISDQDYWYGYTGYDASTFTEQDRIASPGAAGPLAACMTDFGLAFLSKSRRLWMWNGTGKPTDFSSNIAFLLYGTYTMEDIDPTQVQNAVLKWYTFGRYKLLAVFVKTTQSPDGNMDLMQLWSFNVDAEQSSGVYGTGSTVYGQLKGIAQTDKVPSVTFTAAGNVESGYTPYIYCGDKNGNVYRFPDGFTDNGNPVVNLAQLAWMLPNEGKSQYYWVDLWTDRADALYSFQVYAATSDAPDQLLPPTQLSVQQLPSPVHQTAVAIRASLNADGVSSGRFISIYISFPSDTQDAVLSKVIVASRPLNQGIS